MHNQITTNNQIERKNLKEIRKKIQSKSKTKHFQEDLRKPESKIKRKTYNKLTDSIKTK